MFANMFPITTLQVDNISVSCLQTCLQPHCCDISGNSIEMEDASEAESRGKSSAPTSPLILDESKMAMIPEFPLTLLQTQPQCEVYPDLHKIVQVLSAVLQVIVNPLLFTWHSFKL